jgi:hypothetical protein
MIGYLWHVFIAALFFICFVGLARVSDGHG